MDLDESSRKLLSNMTYLVEDLTAEKLHNADPLSVARALISIYDKIENYTKKTQRLSEETRKIRTFFKKANDPNKFLLDDLPSTFKDIKSTNNKAYADEITDKIRDGLNEMLSFYPDCMVKLRTQMFSLIQVYSKTENSLRELRDRAKEVGRVSGYPKLEAFILRLKAFDIEGDSMKEIASLCIHKPTDDWVDNDFDRASIELANLAQEFIRLESLAFVKGRKTHQTSLAIIVGEGGRNLIQQDNFLISKNDKNKADKIKKDIQTLIKKEKYSKKVLLTALSDTAVDLMNKSKKSK
jgi:hypothetical protein